MWKVGESIASPGDPSLQPDLEDPLEKSLPGSGTRCVDATAHPPGAVATAILSLCRTVSAPPPPAPTVRARHWNNWSWPHLVPNSSESGPLLEGSRLG